MTTLASAISTGKASAYMTSNGTPGRYEVRLEGGRLWLTTNYRMAHGFVLRHRLSVALKSFRPEMTDRQIAMAVDYAYYTKGARSLPKAIGHALAFIDYKRAGYC